ncbi:MAG TPA: hypothetical protein VKF14_15250 [Candidatus Dormibacteraeota bacterium]|nr:hypothetical protein [Candidatus Dormibacteraeota bacterium]
MIAANMLVANPIGNYRFLAAEGRPFSAGALADPGFDLVHATFGRPLALEAGLTAAVRQVASAGRPVQAIAGFELRIPAPLTRVEFDAFNRAYVERLRALGLVVEDLMPAARTNVAPIDGAVAEPSVFAVSYTTEADRGRPAFLLSGAPEEEPADPVSMLESMMRALSTRIEELGVSWQDATAVQLYGLEDVQPLLVDHVLRRLGPAAVNGIRWFPARPPVEGLRLEIDVRSAGVELILPA